MYAKMVKLLEDNGVKSFASNAFKGYYNEIMQGHSTALPSDNSFELCMRIKDKEFILQCQL